jgi:glycosyltransferase involved in cell wall biosynthesis
MKVLFVPEWYPSKDGRRWGGIACRDHVRAAALYDDVAVLSFTSRPQRWPTLRWERVHDGGIPVFYGDHGRSPVPKTSLFVFHLHLKRALHRVFEEWGRPDVIHTQDDYGYYAIRALPDPRIPVVISQHSSCFLERALDRAAVRRSGWAFAQAARVLPANKFAERDYRRYGLQPSVTWMPNTFDVEMFRPEPARVRKPWLLHVSGFSPVKRVGDIIHAFRQVSAQRPGAVLHLVGPATYRAATEALAARELAPHTYRFHGVLSQPAIADLMRRASGFVLASEVETFGCVLMEAMACGCPVLTTGTGGIRGVVGPDEGLFVEVGRIEQIAEGMLKLLDGTHGLDMARVSRDIRDRFCYQRVGRLLHEEYERVVHGTDAAAVEAAAGTRPAHAL